MKEVNVTVSKSEPTIIRNGFDDNYDASEYDFGEYGYDEAAALAETIAQESYSEHPEQVKGTQVGNAVAKPVDESIPVTSKATPITKEVQPVEEVKVPAEDTTTDKTKEDDKPAATKKSLLKRALDKLMDILESIKNSAKDRYEEVKVIVKDNDKGTLKKVCGVTKVIVKTAVDVTLGAVEVGMACILTIIASPLLFINWIAER